MQPTPLSESLRGRSVYSDNAKHSALVERILRVDNDAWQRAVSSYRRILQGDDVESRLRALQESRENPSSHATQPQLEDRASICPVCLRLSLTPVLRPDVVAIAGLHADRRLAQMRAQARPLDARVRAPLR